MKNKKHLLVWLLVISIVLVLSLIIFKNMYASPCERIHVDASEEDKMNELVKNYIEAKLTKQEFQNSLNEFYSNDGALFRRDNCYSNEAVKHNDSNICDKTSLYGRNQCFSVMAVYKGDLELCKKVTGLYDLSYFPEITNYPRALCYGFFANHTGNVDACNQLNSKGEIFICKSAVNG